MNNKPSTKVRRRSNANYKHGSANCAAPRQKRRDNLNNAPGYHATSELRMGKNSPLLERARDIQRGKVQP